jgi:hypothetical protein
VRWEVFLNYKKQYLLIPIAILRTAIRALPGNTIAGHTPHILQHTLLTYAETTSAGPAEKRYGTAAIALPVRSPPSLAAITAFSGRFRHILFSLNIG